MDCGTEVDKRKHSSSSGCFVSLWKKRIWAVLAVAVIISCIVAVIALSLVRDPSPNVAGSSDLANKAPSASDGSNLMDRRRYIMFRSALARVSEPSAFVNPNTPQSQALHWLVYKDTTIKISDDQQGMNISQFLYSDNLASSDFHWKLVQRYALMVFAFSTNGVHWRGVEPWVELFETDECHSFFQGVGCDPITGRVTIMDLEYAALSGHIPDEIGLLTDLTYVNLSRNQLEGRIPHMLYKKLTNLEQLLLSSNEIAFPLSKDIGKLTSLNQFDIANTYVSGTLPESMKTLTNLRDLVFANTRLSGNILQYVGNWPNLELLALDDNKAMTGSIPSEIGLCTNLRRWHMAFTGISGSLPTEVGLLSNLSMITLGGEHLSGTIPSEIGSWTNVDHWALMAAPLMTGSLPSTLGRLSALEILSISATSIGGSIPSELGLLTDLKILKLENNLLTGEVPGESFVDMEALTNLQINANFLSGTIPQELCDKPSIVVWLDCSGGLVCENDCCPGVWCSFGGTSTGTRH